MIVDIKSESCVYILIDGWVFYIDNSTNEQIMEKWKSCNEFIKINSSLNNN